jgi:hypothetical protein
MALPAVYRRKVGRDLAGAYGWYEYQRAGLGEEFLGAVDASFDAIREFPEVFAYVHAEVRAPSSLAFRMRCFTASSRSALSSSRSLTWPVTRSSGLITGRRANWASEGSDKQRGCSVPSSLRSSAPGHCRR